MTPPPAPDPSDVAQLPASPASHSAARMLDRLSTRHLGVLAAFLGILLTLPALWTGFAQDDHFFLMVFKGAPGLEMLDRSPLETFSFSTGDERIQPALMERGFQPWWAVPGWKVNFWRPLASLSNWIDYSLFGESPWPMHLHSLLLYGALAFLAAVAYRRLLTSRWAAGLAALLFAVDSGHAIPVTWLSMRNALLTLFFGLLVLLAHDRWRRSENGLRAWFPQGFLAIFWLALALLSGESAVAVGGYLLAYALFLDPALRDGRRRYVRSIGALLPYLVVVLVWRAIYSGLGYGTEGSGLYIDPAANPVEFLSQLPAHLAVLLLGLFALPDAGLWGLLPSPINHVHLAIAGLFLVVAARAVWPLLRARADARFLLLGSLLAAVPACATMPMDRLMMFSSFGALGLVALFLEHLSADDAPTTRAPMRPRLRRLLGGFLVFAHLIVAPLGLLAGTQHIAMMDRILTDSNPSLPQDLPPDARIVAINTPSDLLGASFPIYRSSREEPIAPHWWWLYSGVGDLEVARIDDRTLVLRPEGGYLRAPWAQIFRYPPGDPIAAGDRFALDGLDIKVLATTPDGRPTEVAFRFDVPLEDSSLHFVTWDAGTYVRFTPPDIGMTGNIDGPELAPLLPVALGGAARN